MAARRAPALVRRLPRVLGGLALTVPVLTVVGVLVASVVLVRDPVPDVDTVRLAVPAVPTPAAASADCARLLSGLPGEIRTAGGLLPRRVLADPVPPATIAWGGEDGTGDGGPLVLRCGLPRPPELTPSTPLVEVDGVEWLALPGQQPGRTSWVCVDRAVYVGLTAPDRAGPEPVQDVSRGIKIALVSRSAG